MNGKKFSKKSIGLNVGDEIDVIKGISHLNPDHLIVQRVEVLDVKAKDGDDGIIVILKRAKSLTIDNYEEDSYKENSST